MSTVIISDVATGVSATGTPRTGRRYPVHYALLGIIVVVVFIAELCIGTVAVQLGSVSEILFTGSSSNDIWNKIILEFRLPRAIIAVLAGAALGGAGLMLQTLFRNPLADPFVLGISHGAGLGVAAVVVFSGVTGSDLALRCGLVGNVSLAIAAVLGTILVLALLEIASRRVSTIILLAVGLMLGYFAVGAISVILHFADPIHYLTYQK